MQGKLFGHLRDLQRTAAFMRGVGVSIRVVDKKNKIIFSLCVKWMDVMNFLHNWRCGHYKFHDDDEGEGEKMCLFHKCKGRVKEIVLSF